MAKKKDDIIKVVAIGGPTASGKTEASLVLAKKYNGAIISCDSRQIYREMDIATDKIDYSLPYTDPITYKGIDHYGINVTTIDSPWSLYEWQKYAQMTINKIVRQNKIPFLVGGTGLYIQSIVSNYILHADFDADYRKKLNKLSLYELRRKLRLLDDKLFHSIDNKNPRRLIRAIENKYFADPNFEKIVTEKQSFQKYQGIILSFNTDREKIRKKIVQRVEIHLKKGVVDEVIRLIKKYGVDDPILNSTISVQEYIPYINGKISLEEAKERVIVDNYQYAKRQITWFKKYGNTIFCDDITIMEREIGKFLGSKKDE